MRARVIYLVPALITLACLAVMTASHNGLI